MFIDNRGNCPECKFSFNQKKKVMFKKIFPKFTLAGLLIGLLNLSVVALIAFIAVTILSGLAVWSVAVFNWLK